MKHVIFGSGPLGRAVLNQLLERQEPVRVVNRSGAMQGVPSSVEVVKADAYDLESAKRASLGASVIYNCAAPDYSVKAWQTQLPLLWGNIARSAAQHKAKLVIGDNLYMYDQADASNIREDLPMRSTTGKGKARIAVTEQMLELHSTGQVQIAFVRGADFYGPHGTDQSQFGSRMIPPLLHGKAAQVIGHSTAPHSITYLPDFGRAIVMVAQDSSAFGQAWHVPNAPARSRLEVMKMIATIIGAPLKIQMMGKPMLAVLGLFVPILREVAEMGYQFEKPYIVNHDKFVNTFGDIHTPLETALQHTVEWFKTLESSSSSDPRSKIAG